MRATLHSMDDRTMGTRTELAHRSSSGLGVALVWVRGEREGEDRAVVCVCDWREGAYFEITADPHLALDVYHHPFVYRDAASVDYQNDRLAA